MSECKLTIFTPTYNRGYCLENLYKSLLRQKYSDFEWLIIDDASTDDTEQHVRKWIEEATININYIKQQHGGKHRAINKAVEIAKGEYFFIVDSDDIITDNAIELIYKWINSIKEEKIAGVSGTRMNRAGKIWGGIPNINPKDYIEATNFEREKYNLLGDKAEIFKTKILKKYKFPEFENEYFVTEDVCFQEIAANGYKIRWYNEPIYICEYLEDGLTKNGANNFNGHKNNFKGYCYWIKRGLKVKPFENEYLLIKDYIKTSKNMKISLGQMAKNIETNIIKFMFYIIIAPLSYITRKIKIRKWTNGRVGKRCNNNI